jgi:acetamidase/formamidase
VRPRRTISSVAVDVRITNLVNTPNVAVSAMLSQDIFED